MSWQHKHSSGPRWRRRDSHCAACGEDRTGQKAGERRGSRFICRACTGRWTFEPTLGMVVDRDTGRPMADVLAEEPQP
jgi:hypothetical protein